MALQVQHRHRWRLVLVGPCLVLARLKQGIKRDFYSLFHRDLYWLAHQKVVSSISSENSVYHPKRVKLN